MRENAYDCVRSACQRAEIYEDIAKIIIDDRESIEEVTRV